MKIPVLLVNYEPDALNHYKALLSENGVAAHNAASMQEALDMLLKCEYAGIAINADNEFEYLPLLKVMRVLTPAPIGISASRYNRDEHEAAVVNGASLYRTRYDQERLRVKSFSDMAKIYLAFDPQKRQPAARTVCGDIRLDLETRRAFVKDQEIHLKKTGFDILRYLAINKGIVLSYEQIFRNVWGEGYEDSSKETLRNHIGDIRRAIKAVAPQREYIRTVRGIGYMMEG